MFELFLKWISKGEKPVFVKNRQEFLSIWSIAHAWEGLEPELTNAQDIPASIQANMDMLMLAYFRKEIIIRRSNGYRLIGHSLLYSIFLMDKEYMRLSDQLYRKDPLDKEFLDSLYVMRSDILHWCEKEFREPPACWMPIARTTPVDERAAEDDDESTTWYDKLTDRRKTIVAGLEVAKALWKQNDSLSYDEVYRHPAMTTPGFHRAFSLDSFKKWARPFAPEKVRAGGRRPQSIS